MPKQTIQDPDGCNDARCDRGAVIIASYEVIPDVDPDSVITDLLADLMHYCAANGIDFGAHLSSAHMHFEAETESDATWHPVLDSVLTEEE